MAALLVSKTASRVDPATLREDRTQGDSITVEDMTRCLLCVQLGLKKCETIVASRLRKFARQWFQFTNDPWVLGVVSNGLKLGLIERPVQFWRSNGSSEISFYH